MFCSILLLTSRSKRRVCSSQQWQKRARAAERVNVKWNDMWVGELLLLWLGLEHRRRYCAIVIMMEDFSSFTSRFWLRRTCCCCVCRVHPRHRRRRFLLIKLLRLSRFSICQNHHRPRSKKEMRKSPGAHTTHRQQRKAPQSWVSKLEVLHRLAELPFQLKYDNDD